MRNYYYHLKYILGSNCKILLVTRREVKLVIKYGNQNIPIYKNNK